jgi:hypothetical protein
MQFAEHGRLVPSLLKQLWKGNLGGIERIMVIYLSINMGMLPCKDGGPGWGTDGIGNTCISEQNPFLGQPIYIWSLDQMITIGTYGLICMIIGHNKQDIGFLGLLGFLLSTAV